MTRKEYDARPNHGGFKVSPNTGLAPDYLNAWILVAQAILEISACTDKVTLDQWSKYLTEPVKKYWEYLNRNADTDEIPFLTEDTNPEALKKIDALVDEYNGSLPSSEEDIDLEAAKVFFDRADLLIRGRTTFNTI